MLVKVLAVAQPGFKGSKEMKRAMDRPSIERG